ncbi:MAG: MTAP family purine nucleoside phosphorylase [Fibrobacteres bacterium]|nr:MTAP family purine nucleoside phosphorylase [Fibrobacterota bacterium]
MPKLGIIGGSGLYRPEIFEKKTESNTPNRWGNSSTPIQCGTIAGVEVSLLNRHGFDHTIPPSQVNFRANLQALRDLGVKAILATSAMGSLREEIQPGDLVFPSQFVDFTKSRKSTIHEEFQPHQPIHTSLADPFDADLRKCLKDTADALGIRSHAEANLVTIEGPRFSTRAESNLFRLWGMDVINMTTSTEATLAAEFGIRYATIGLSTDYDCWKTDAPPVTWEEALAQFAKNIQKVLKVLGAALPRIEEIVV